MIIDTEKYRKLIKHMREEAQDYRSGKTLGRAFVDAEDVLDEAADAIGDLLAALTPPNDPLTQADLDSMDYDKVWIDYEDDCGEWALVCNGYIYSIDTLEGAGLDFGDYMRGERLEPHGYKVYRRPPEGEV